MSLAADAEGDAEGAREVPNPTPSPSQACACFDCWGGATCAEALAAEACVVQARLPHVT